MIYTFLTSTGRTVASFRILTGVHVPKSDYPLRPEELAGLHAAVDPLAPSTCMEVDIYMAAVQYMQSLGYI